MCLLFLLTTSTCVAQCCLDGNWVESNSRIPFLQSKIPSIASIMLNYLRLFRLQVSPYLSHYKHLSKFKDFKQQNIKQIQELKEKLDSERVFTNITVDDFKEIYRRDAKAKAKIIKVIDIYDSFKFNLENVPSKLTQDDIVELIKYDEFSYVKRCLTRYYSREIDQLVKKELKKEIRQKTEGNFDHEAPCGVFDPDGSLQYGLWRNCLVTRLPKINRTRFNLDRHRNAELFGQNLYLDFSFASYIIPHLCARVASEITRTLHCNRFLLGEPFKITLCGVDYDSNLWKEMEKGIHNFDLQDTISHTKESYLKLCPNASDIVYITNLETDKFLEYDPNAHYVMAAVSERDIQSSKQNFLIPELRRLKVRRQCIPIDQHVLWEKGSKLLTVDTRLRILHDHRNKLGWKENLVKNIGYDCIKSEKQIKKEDIKLSRWVGKKKTNRPGVY